MCNWQPIETAPKDGTIFDVWLGNADLEELVFYCTKGTCRSPGWHWINGKFRPYTGLTAIVPMFISPTHWMPLPEGPKNGT